MTVMHKAYRMLTLLWSDLLLFSQSLEIPGIEFFPSLVFLFYS